MARQNNKMKKSANSRQRSSNVRASHDWLIKNHVKLSVRKARGQKTHTKARVRKVQKFVKLKKTSVGKSTNLF